jgi:hypothetical protein
MKKLRFSSDNSLSIQKQFALLTSHKLAGRGNYQIGDVLSKGSMNYFDVVSYTPDSSFTVSGMRQLTVAGVTVTEVDVDVVPEVPQTTPADKIERMLQNIALGRQSARNVVESVVKRSLLHNEAIDWPDEVDVALDAFVKALVAAAPNVVADDLTQSIRSLILIPLFPSTATSDVVEGAENNATYVRDLQSLLRQLDGLRQRLDLQPTYIRNKIPNWSILAQSFTRTQDEITTSRQWVWDEYVKSSGR